LLPNMVSPSALRVGFLASIDELSWNMGDDD
jgi:hypothetical protein